MSKERLEEMKGVISTWKTILSEGNFADVTSEEVELVEYVIQQAERVQEMEEDKKALGDLIEKTAKAAWNIEQQNKRYREGLEFYADKKKYMYKSTSLKGHPTIINDEGETAIEALEGEE